MSPESALAGIPSVDGCIAQVWTGTSRVPNVYEGVCRQRTLETAFLEYGMLRELARPMKDRVWFLADPIEDRPSYTWEDYRFHYEKTLAASLLYPDVFRYEVCPWPARVFDGLFPGKGGEKAARPIPDAYRTFLSGTFQMLRDMEQPDAEWDGAVQGVGIFLSDTAMFQRTFPDTVPCDPSVEDRLIALAEMDRPVPCTVTPQQRADSLLLMREVQGDEATMNGFLSSLAFPAFYALALPLVKYGLPLRPLQLEHLLRLRDGMEGIRLAILSYEFMKPLSPALHDTLAGFVRAGGTLVYAGDGSDPFHALKAWWREAGYRRPDEHLMEVLGLGREPGEGVYPCGKGRVAVLRTHPARLCLDREGADRWRTLIRSLLAGDGIDWVWRNDLTLRRGPYLISAVMDESVSDAPRVFEGTFIDMTCGGYPIVHRVCVPPDHTAILYDLSRAPREGTAVLATAARLEALEAGEDAVCLTVHSAARVRTPLRLRLPFVPGEVSAAEDGGGRIRPEAAYDAQTRTLLVTYVSSGKPVTFRISRHPA